MSRGIEFSIALIGRVVLSGVLATVGQAAHGWAGAQKVPWPGRLASRGALGGFDGVMEAQRQPVGTSYDSRASFQQVIGDLVSTWSGKFSVTISADGFVDCSARSRARDYQSKFRLRLADLRELEKILQQTDWLAKSLPQNAAPGIDDATFVKITVNRGGQERAVRFDLQNPEPYRALGVFIRRPGAGKDAG